MNSKVLPAPATGPHQSTGLYVKSRNGLKLRDRKVQRLVRRMRAVLPWLEDADIPACRAWAQFEVLCDQVHAWLRAGNVVNEQGEARRLLDDYRKLRQAQLMYSRELGLTPASRQALKASGTRAALDVVAAMNAEEVKE